MVRIAACLRPRQPGFTQSSDRVPESLAFGPQLSNTFLGTSHPRAERQTFALPVQRTLFTQSAQVCNSQSETIVLNVFECVSNAAVDAYTKRIPGGLQGNCYIAISIRTTNRSRSSEEDVRIWYMRY